MAQRIPARRRMLVSVTGVCVAGGFLLWATHPSLRHPPDPFLELWTLAAPPLAIAWLWALRGWPAAGWVEVTAHAVVIAAISRAARVDLTGAAYLLPLVGRLHGDPRLCLYGAVVGAALPWVVRLDASLAAASPLAAAVQTGLLLALAPAYARTAVREEAPSPGGSARPPAPVAPALDGLLVAHAADLLALHDRDGVFVHVSPSCRVILGYEPGELVGTPLAALVHPEDAAAVDAALAAARQGRRTVVSYRARTRAGGWIWLETAVVPVGGDAAGVHLQTASRDVTERKALEQQLSFHTLHDPVTRLPTRLLFTDRLHHALVQAQRRGDRVAVLWLDLDGFRRVNDSLGHAAGDRVLMRVGERLRSCLQEGDTFARLGGDEFAVLLEGVTREEEVADVARRLLAALAEPFTVDGHEVAIGASIGIAQSAPGARSVEDLLRQAETAMYQAKRAGKGRFVFYRPAERRARLTPLELERDLRRALARDELRLYYQPIYSIRTRQLVGFEALVRWQHPELGQVMPSEFIQAAEETGLIVPLGRWVLRHACRRLADWHPRWPVRPLPFMSVNVSPRQLESPDFVDDLLAATREAGVDPRYLHLELTERVLLNPDPDTVERLKRLRELGFRLAIDDFGTGFAWISYLNSFPFDSLKIDRVYVEKLCNDHRDAAIVRGIIALAKELNLVVNAEGIENAEQLAELEARGCEWGQGYYFARPLSEEDVARLLPAPFQPARGERLPASGGPADAPEARTAAP